MPSASKHLAKPIIKTGSSSPKPTVSIKTGSSKPTPKTPIKKPTKGG